MYSNDNNIIKNCKEEIYTLEIARSFSYRDTSSTLYIPPRNSF